MRIICCFGSFWEQEIGLGLFETLRELVPEGVTIVPAGTVLSIKLPIEDGRFEVVKGLLADEGFLPWADTFHAKKVNEYTLNYLRTYDGADLDASEFLECQPREEAYFQYSETPLAGGGHRIDLENIFDVPAGEKEIVGLAATGDYFLVSMRVRGILEAARLPHLHFCPAAVAVTKYSGEEVLLLPEGHLWKLTSDFTMPALNPINLFNNDGKPFSGDPKAGCFVKEGFFQRGELHYRRRDVAGLPSFGLALTREWPGNNRLIASKGFYEACREHDLQLNWTPVRIDD